MKPALRFLLPLAIFLGFKCQSQSCAQSPLFRKGTQFVFQSEIKSLSSGSATPSSTPDIKTRRTYTVESVGDSSGYRVAKFVLSRTEQLSGPTATTPANPGSVFLNASCNAQGLIYNVAVKSRSGFIQYAVAFPSNMSVGAVLKPESFNIDISQGASKPGRPSAINITISRKVIGRESLTTPAGTWNCYKVEETSSYQMIGADKTAAPGGANATVSYFWYTAEIGIVKFSTGSNTTTYLLAVN